MRMPQGDWLAFRAAETCHVCDKPLEGDSVRDHCHITGKYRGAAHTTCNLKLRLSPKTTAVPVVFHNLRGYDSHLLMQPISKVEGRVHCIPNNTEKYISFSLGQLRFIDSVQFLLASLDRLVAANPPEAFRISAQHEPDRRVASGRCLRDVPEDVPPPVWPGPGSLLYQPGPFVGRLAQEDRR